MEQMVFLLTFTRGGSIWALDEELVSDLDKYNLQHQKVLLGLWAYNKILMAKSY